MKKTIQEIQREKLNIFSELVKEITNQLFTGPGSIKAMGAMFIPGEPSKSSPIPERQQGKTGLGIMNLEEFFTCEEAFNTIHSELDKVFEEVRPTGFATIIEASIVRVKKEDIQKFPNIMDNLNTLDKIPVVNISLESHNRHKFIIFKIVNNSLELDKETEWEGKKTSNVVGKGLNMLNKDYSAFGEDLKDQLGTHLN